MTEDNKPFTKWWTKTAEGAEDTSQTPHTDVFSTLRSIKTAQRFRLEADKIFLKLYSDLRYVGFEASQPDYSPTDILSGLLSSNVIKSVVQTAHAKLDKIKIQPKPYTEGGNWKLQWNAQQLDKYIRGTMYEHRGDELLSDMRLQSMILGTGGIKVYNDGRQVCAETTLSSEWWVDASEARYRRPRTFYQEKAYDRDELKAMFQDYADQIEGSKSSANDRIPFFWTGADTTSDMLYVVEAWHMPSVLPKDDEEKTDGRHVICLPDLTLLNEEWRRSRPPVAWMRWSLRGRGFWGAGLVEDLISQQLEYNATLQARQEAMRYMSAPYWAVEKGSKVIKSHLSDEIGRIVEFVGTPPVPQFPKGVDNAVFQHGESVRRQMFEDSGISQLAASMQKPAGLNSGKAIRTYVDLESERIISALHQSEQAVLDYAELILDESEALAKVNPDLAVVFVGDKNMERVEFGKARMDRDKFRLKIAPISALSQSFAGRLQDVYELRDLGLVSDKSEMRQLLGMPDLAESDNRALAQRNMLLRVIEEQILKKGQYVQPDPLWDMKLALTLALESLSEAEFNEGLEPGNVDLLRQFIAEVALKISGSAAPSAPMTETAPTAPALPFAPEGPMVPGAMPMPPGGAPLPAGPVPPGAMAGAPMGVA
jgi:hypothetical protein